LFGELARFSNFQAQGFGFYAAAAEIAAAVGSAAAPAAAPLTSTPTREGVATILQHEGRHASVLVQYGDEAVATEQEILNQMRETTIKLVSSPAPVVRSVRIVLPDAPAALRYQWSVLGTRTGIYNKFTNSCLTHCGDVLRAGGVQGIPRGTTSLLRWLRTQ
jgi:hypothetical protein